MTEQVTRMADAVAAATSRRGFLGRLVRLAGGVAACAAGVLVATTAHAKPGRGSQGSGKPGLVCCYYYSIVDGGEFAVCVKTKDPDYRCPDEWGGLYGTYFTGQRSVEHCRDCSV